MNWNTWKVFVLDGLTVPRNCFPYAAYDIRRILDIFTHTVTLLVRKQFSFKIDFFFGVSFGDEFVCLLIFVSY